MNKTEQLIKCPDCGAQTRAYHEYGGVTRIVCSKKCNGWKVIKEIDHCKIKEIPTQ